MGITLGLPNSSLLGKQGAVGALDVPPTQMSDFKKISKRKTCLYPREIANTRGWAVDDMGHTHVYTKVRAPRQESQTEIKASDRSTERSAHSARKGAKRQLESSVSLSLKWRSWNLCVESGQVQLLFFFPFSFLSSENENN